MIFENEKTPFQAIKTRSSESRKIDIFPRGLTHGYGPKIAIFRNFFFYTLQTRKMYSMIFQNEKMLVQGIKSRSSESRKIDVFPKRLTHGFGRKMANFSTFFVYAIQTRKMYAMRFQDEKTPFQAKKTRSSKSPKIDIFPKRLTHRFGPKIAIFPFFLTQYIPAKCIL